MTRKFCARPELKKACAAAPAIPGTFTSSSCWRDVHA